MSNNADSSDMGLVVASTVASVNVDCSKQSACRISYQFHTLYLYQLQSV